LVDSMPKMKEVLHKETRIGRSLAYSGGIRPRIGFRVTGTEEEPGATWLCAIG
jgi:hypothetical protein